ncbi:MAG: 2-C-methyl-D-erythritol 4-phosphate cytidylyltransferase [Deltaproteobacteria bacterium]|nr:MAG: 2-C-methyl-D-erythritol 4-phosphate cytidylyltransferase [Deltaproteobacteria bacterium]
MSAVAIIVAAGKGERFGGEVPKQFLPVGKRALIEFSLQEFSASPVIDSIIVVVPRGIPESLVNLIMTYRKVDAVVFGGKTRQESVEAGVRAVRGNPDVVLVHDGARPLVSGEIIERVYREAKKSGAAIPVVPIPDSVKRSEDGRVVDRSVPRETLFRAQTPQGVRFELLKRALEKAREEGVSCSDEAQLVELLGEKVSLVPGSRRNLKVTFPEDILSFKAFIGEYTGDFRVGIGYDAHRLVEGRPLYLGGIEIEFDRGLLGHSDGDCLLHALTDALLGAAGLGDIGKHFPPGDPSTEGIRSTEIVRHAVELLSGEGYRVVNADCVVVCEKPKIGPLSDKMRESIASLLGVSPEDVSVKGKTTEGMGFEGRGEGISSLAVVLVEKVPSGE